MPKVDFGGGEDGHGGVGVARNVGNYFSDGFTGGNFLQFKPGFYKIIFWLFWCVAHSMASFFRFFDFLKLKVHRKT